MTPLLFSALQLFYWQFFPISHVEKWIARTIVAVLGKALSESSFTIIFLYTAELFPTVVRSVFEHIRNTSDRMHTWQCWNDSYRLAFSLSLSLILFQTKRCWFYIICCTAGCVHLATDYAIGGRVAPPTFSHLLCCGSRMRFGKHPPARDPPYQTARDHWGHWETKEEKKCVWWKLHLNVQEHTVTAELQFNYITITIQSKFTKRNCVCTSKFYTIVYVCVLPLTNSGTGLSARLTSSEIRNTANTGLCCILLMNTKKQKQLWDTSEGKGHV